MIPPSTRAEGVFFLPLPGKGRLPGRPFLFCDALPVPAGRAFWAAPVPWPAPNIPAMGRGRMYAARSGVLGGTRIWDGHMVPATSGVGRGLDPAVFPAGMGFTGWPPHPGCHVGRAFTPAAGRLPWPGTPRATGTSPGGIHAAPTTIHFAHHKTGNGRPREVGGGVKTPPYGAMDFFVSGHPISVRSPFPPTAAGEIARPTNQWQAPYKIRQRASRRETVAGFIANIFAMGRGRMYAARTGVLGGTRIWDGHMVPVTSGVGRGRTPPRFRPVWGSRGVHPIPDAL